ncbi:alpha/beta hydrolase [Sorangium cellulosum]|uniref:Alpha/beta hydrolase n=2 Tax=Sorangium cellulosum TaxID=56 RepID=A0A4P2Q5F6_SORCE|nr:alpha/beta hydrolase [Sorangium cellulosum]
MPVVLLPSMLIRGMSYRSTVKEAAQRARVLVVELPGSGRGSRLRAPWTLERYARCIADTLEVLQLERVTLIGHSLSGAAALVAGAMYPERLAGLVLVNSVGVNPPRSILALLLARAADVSLEPRFSAHAGPGLLYNLIFHTRNALSLLRIAAMAELSGYAALVGRARLRTLLAWGARDHTTPLGSALELRRLIPGSILHVSTKGSHDWLVERPAEFADVLARFMEDRSG